MPSDAPIVPDADAATPVVSLEGVGKLYWRGEVGTRSLKETLLQSISHRTRKDLLAALEDVNLTIRPGEAVGVIGSNGAGKSTLLKLIAGITEPTTGRVETRGRVLGLIELGAGFHEDLTGEENVRLQGAIYGMRADAVEALIDPIFEFAELNDFRGLPVRHFSSGMFLRLGFAIAAHTEPDVLLVDEALAVGDLAFQDRCLEEARRMRERGVALILVSHNEAQIERVCERVVWMDRGRLRADGPIEATLAAYRDSLLRERYSEPIASAEDDEVIARGTPGRYGGERARIEQLRILDAQGRPRISVGLGESFTVEITYRVDETLDAVDCYLYFHSMAGVAVTSMWMSDCLPASRPVGGRGVARMHVDASPLLPGTYLLSASLLEDGERYGRRYDVLVNVLRIRVRSVADWDTLGAVDLRPRLEIEA